MAAWTLWGESGGRGFADCVAMFRSLSPGTVSKLGRALHVELELGRAGPPHNSTTLRMDLGSPPPLGRELLVHDREWQSWFTRNPRWPAGRPWMASGRRSMPGVAFLPRVWREGRSGPLRRSGGSTRHWRPCVPKNGFKTIRSFLRCKSASGKFRRTLGEQK